MISERGTAYGVGVGPGDPELMTLKACRMIRENDVIVVPGSKAHESTAYRIAVRAVPELAQKELIAVSMPMTRDAAVLAENHRRAADIIEEQLDAGRNVVYLTLGDPSVYCSFSYIQKILEEEGYRTELVSGVPSFCAAAARLGVSLTERDDPLHIVPAAWSTEIMNEWPGSFVLMKSGRRMAEIREMLKDSGKEVRAVENCGMEREKVYRSLEEIPDDAGYFTVMIAGAEKETE